MFCGGAVGAERENEGYTYMGRQVGSYILYSGTSDKGHSKIKTISDNGQTIFGH